MANSFVNKQGYLGLIYEYDGYMFITDVDHDSQEIIQRFGMQNKKFKSYCKKMMPLFQKIYKFVFVVTSKFKPGNYSNSDKFWDALKEALNSANIPNYFLPRINWYFSAMMVSTQIVPKIDDSIIFISISDKSAEVKAYKYLSNGFVGIGFNNISMRDLLFSIYEKDTRDRILSTCNNKPLGIFILHTELHCNQVCNMRRLKYILDECNIFNFDYNSNFCIDHEKVIKEQYKLFANKACLYIQPTKVELAVKFGDIRLPLITVGINETLPFTRKLTLKKIVHFCELSLKDEQDGTLAILKTWLPDQKAHQHIINFSMSDDGFVDCRIDAILLPHVKRFPQLLNEKMPELDTPIIGFFENLSFICIRHEQAGYKYLKSWNGSKGVDMYVSFDEENPKFFQSAVEAAKTKPTFVVFDIFEIMCMSPDNIQSAADRRFQIIKNDDHPIVLEFDYFHETEKLSTPAFLMALFLKQHLKAIKKETGEKPKQIAILLFADLKKEEYQRVQNQFTEACKLLKISSIFLDNKNFKF